MPIPTPLPGETDRDDFLARCMSDETMVDEYREDQRAAICHSQWRAFRGAGDLSAKSDLSSYDPKGVKRLLSLIDNLDVLRVRAAECGAKEGPAIARAYIETLAEIRERAGRGYVDDVGIILSEAQRLDVDALDADELEALHERIHERETGAIAERGRRRQEAALASSARSDTPYMVATSEARHYGWEFGWVALWSSQDVSEDVRRTALSMIERAGADGMVSARDHGTEIELIGEDPKTLVTKWAIRRDGSESEVGILGQLRLSAGDRVLLWGIRQPGALGVSARAIRLGAVSDDALAALPGRFVRLARGDAQYGVQKTGLHEYRLSPILSDDEEGARASALAGKVVFAMETGEWRVSWPVHRFGGQRWYADCFDLEDEIRSARETRTMLCWQKPGLPAAVEDWREGADMVSSGGTGYVPEGGR